MRLIHFPTAWTVLLDIVAWFIVHVGVVYLTIRIPARRFNPNAWLYRSRAWERHGAIYHRVFRIRNWKGYLPDAAPFLGDRGFPKKRLQERSRSHLHGFLIETCRAELTHWTILLFGPLFILWNKFGIGILMIAYGLAENIPLIMAQRYNRARLRRILARKP